MFYDRWFKWQGGGLSKNKKNGKVVHDVGNYRKQKHISLRICNIIIPQINLTGKGR